MAALSFDSALKRLSQAEPAHDAARKTFAVVRLVKDGSHAVIFAVEFYGT